MNNALALLLIDPQIDFCDPDTGALYVPGAERDMDRLASFIRRLGHRISSIHVTLDSHHLLHIANPLFWIDDDGTHPTPFTAITASEVRDGRWSATNPALADYARKYVTSLEQNGRYNLTIWPPHCLIGSVGHAVYPSVFRELVEWEANHDPVDFVFKGSNTKTEHYSAVRADVPDPEDPSTQFNRGLVSRLERAGSILVAGEALTHCVANSVRDIAAGFAHPASIGKLVLLTDATSGIPGFEVAAESFLSEMSALGMRLSTTDAFDPDAM